MLDNNNVSPSYCVTPSFASGLQSNQRDSAPAFHVSTGASREPQTLSRELRAMGYRKLAARPRHHAQAEGAIEDSKKTSRPSGRDRAREKKVDPGAIEI
jgi:winged helix-turn-helix protein